MAYKHEGKLLYCRRCGQPLREEEMTLHFLCRACIKEEARAEEHPDVTATPNPRGFVHEVKGGA